MEETTTTMDDDEEPVADTILQPVLEVLDAVHAISTDSTDNRTQPLLRRRNSAWRANRILGRIVPPLLLAFILNGWYYVQTEMCALNRNSVGFLVLKSWIKHPIFVIQATHMPQLT
jgi:hypothetical protein